MDYPTEVVHGRRLVVRHFFHWSEIEPDQRWAPASGADWEVRVLRASEVEVVYTDKNGTQFDKDPFSFQCRYCLVLLDAV